MMLPWCVLNLNCDDFFDRRNALRRRGGVNVHVKRSSSRTSSCTVLLLASDVRRVGEDNKRRSCSWCWFCAGGGWSEFIVFCRQLKLLDTSSNEDFSAPKFSSTTDRAPMLRPSVRPSVSLFGLAGSNTLAGKMQNPIKGCHKQNNHQAWAWENGIRYSRRVKRTMSRKSNV